MPHQVRYYASLEIAEVTYSGIVTAADVQGNTTEMVALQRQNGVTRFLINLGDLEVRMAPAELEKLLDEQYRAEGVNRGSRIAIIQPTTESAKAAAQYFVDACQTRGWKSCMLPDRRAAMDWLAK